MRTKPCARIHPDGAADIVGFEAAADIDADDHNTDVYVEAAIPLLAGLPGVESLETVLGFRHSDYASAGGVDAWKAELLYQPATRRTPARVLPARGPCPVDL